MAEEQISTIFALLSKRRAIDAVEELRKAREGEKPILRQLAKASETLLGHMFLGFERPQDSTQERIVRFETEHPLRAKAALHLLPGVRFLGSYTEDKQSKKRGGDKRPPSSGSGIVLALLSKENLSGIEILHEIQKEEPSNVPVVRRILDEKLGTVSLVTTRPLDNDDARFIRIVSEDPIRTKNILHHQTPGVSFAVLAQA